ncbi:MAG TPA: transglutaminase domain-containing protein [Vulgatibacter sp.]|nr:transglutaminase domain-containing protein [Vulgatibacter sp.]
MTAPRLSAILVCVVPAALATIGLVGAVSAGDETGPAPRKADAQAVPSIERTVRLTVRVEGNGGDAYVELPLAQSDEHQTITDETLVTRGFQVEEVMRDGNRLAILTFPKLEGPRRITYQFTARIRSTKVDVPATPVSVGDPPEEDRAWLRPTRHLQSTSPIIREKLIGFARPRMEAGENDAIRLAWDLARTAYERRKDGSRTVLKATRTGHASDRGIDRLFATFLRTSGVPSRPVFGVDVGKRKGGRLTTWVEAKAGGAWVPMSAPRNLWGRLPNRYVKLAHGDRPFIVREGVESVRFRWKISRPVHTAEEVQ